MRIQLLVFLASIMMYDHAYANEQCTCSGGYQVFEINSGLICRRPVLIKKNAVCYGGGAVQIDVKSGNRDLCNDRFQNTLPEGFSVNELPVAYLNKWKLSTRRGLDVWTKIDFDFKNCQ